ncbi:MAG: tetratricopeptide repeat protein [Spirochaetota bacterium]
MSLLGLLLGLCTALSAQFLTPEETVKLPTPAEVPAAPAAAPRPDPAPVQPNTAPPAPAPVSSEADAYFADFSAYSREKNIILTWHLARGRTIERRIQIYRFTEEPRVIHDISRGTLIAKLSGEINLYEDLPPAKGTYYYAIFVESVRGLEPASFNISRNLVGPVAFNLMAGSAAAPAGSKEPAPPPQKYPRPEFESEEVQGDEEEDEPAAAEVTAEEKHTRGINAAIRRTFFRGDYQQAVRELKPFLRNSSARVRAKAMFYTGLSRYRMGQYDRALKYFNHPLTKKFYRRNAEFWIRKTTENLR